MVILLRRSRRAGDGWDGSSADHGSTVAAPSPARRGFAHRPRATSVTFGIRRAGRRHLGMWGSGSRPRPRRNTMTDTMPQRRRPTGSTRSSPTPADTGARRGRGSPASSPSPPRRRRDRAVLALRDDDPNQASAAPTARSTAQRPRGRAAAGHPARHAGGVGRASGPARGCGAGADRRVGPRQRADRAVAGVARRVTSASGRRRGWPAEHARQNARYARVLDVGHEPAGRARARRAAGAGCATARPCRRGGRGASRCCTAPCRSGRAASGG